MNGRLHLVCSCVDARRPLPSVKSEVTSGDIIQSNFCFAQYTKMSLEAVFSSYAAFGAGSKGGAAVLESAKFAKVSWDFTSELSWWLTTACPCSSAVRVASSPGS